MRRHEAQVAIIAFERERGMKVLVEIGKQRIAGQMLHQLHPVAREQRTRRAPPPIAPAMSRDALMLPASADGDQCRREAERERRFRQLKPDRHAGQEGGDERDCGRLPQRAAAQRFVLHDQHRDAREDEHAQHIVVVVRAEQVERQAAGLAEQRERRGAELVIVDAQGLARDDVERHDVGALHGAEHREREPGRLVRREPVERNVEERIVVARLMRDGDVDPQAVVQEGVGDVPVVVAEIPGRVLAQIDDQAGPERDGRGQEQPLA